MVKKITRSIAPLLLLFLSAMPLLFALFIQVKQEVIRNRMKANLASLHLQTITVRKENVRWVEGEKEILVNGRMFDIKSRKLQNDIYSFSGLYDDDETTFVQQIENSHQRNQAFNNEIATRVFQWLQSIFYQPACENIVAQQFYKQKTVFITPVLPEQPKTIPAPPPWPVSFFSMLS